MYFVHGMRGAYNFDEAPLDGEHVYWNGGNQNSNELNALIPELFPGYWLAIRPYAIWIGRGERFWQVLWIINTAKNSDTD